MTASNVICTVGTSLFFPNLKGLDPQSDDPVLAALARAYTDGNWPQVAAGLAKLPPHERVCGAEINSLTSLAKRKVMAPDANLFFCHSATDDGRHIAQVLSRYYRDRGFARVECHEVEQLQDAKPELFRTHGLRNLVKEICAVLNSFGVEHTLINATGGYKAQIAVSVLVGQATGVPVYYKHERFDEIIAVPPLPIALDVELWMAASSLLFALEDTDEVLTAEDLRQSWEGQWDDRLESLLDRVTIDGQECWELSAAGQLFHQTLSTRFARQAQEFAPPAVSPDRKRPPRLEDSGHMEALSDLRRFLQKVTDEVGPVIGCSTTDIHAHLPRRIQFRLGSHGVEGLYPAEGYTVRFRVESDASTRRQELGLVALLNQWLAGSR